MSRDIFNSIPSFTPPRSRQIQKSSHAMDMECGIAYPIYTKSLVPGDSVSFNLSDVIRSLPMIKPTMGDLDLCVNAFWCDYRQVDDNFVKNLTGTDEDGELSVDFTPVIDSAYTESNATDSRLNGNKMAMHCEKYSLMDYFGAPLLKSSDTNSFIGSDVHMLPYYPLVYGRIWNHYYRDENVCRDSSGRAIKEHEKIGDGRTPLGAFGNTDGNVYCLKPGSGLLHVYLEKDYLSACLPRRMLGGPFAFPITGDLPVSVPSQGTIGASSRFFNPALNVSGVNRDMHLILYKADGTPLDYNSDSFPTYTDEPLYDANGNIASVKVTGGEHDGKFTIGTLQPEYNSAKPLSVSLGSSVTFTYDEFREVQALQLYAERQNLCGSRYEEFLQSMFSVAPHSDSLREPLWLAGASQPVVVNEVMQNTETSDSPLGNYAGKGSSSSSGHFFNFFAKEYGCIMIIAHIRPKVLYTQGIDRNLLKLSRFDWFNPIFAGLSEQPVYKCEAHTTPVATSSTASKALEILGFGPRYSEMYFDKSMASGDLRDQQPYWVWSREFASDAVLNGEFALCKHSEYSDRWSVLDLPPFIAKFDFVCDITRPCSAYPVPQK